MSAKKMIMGIVKLGAMGIITYLAYKIGECNGEMNEHIHAMADVDDKHTEYDYDEPDDGCLAPANDGDTM